MSLSAIFPEIIVSRIDTSAIVNQLIKRFCATGILKLLHIVLNDVIHCRSMSLNESSGNLLESVAISPGIVPLVTKYQMIIQIIAAGIGAGMFLTNFFHTSKNHNTTTKRMILAMFV